MSHTISKQSITYAAAARMVDGALVRAGELGCNQVVAVVDVGGNLLAFARMDNAPIIGIEGAQRKAYTALLGISTEAFYEAIKDNQGVLLGLSELPGSIMVPGGLPVIVDGECVGGIGVSGGLQEEDVACAQAGLDVLASE